jgi:glycine/D-amino acid oxidase-like deaminating enzyme
VPTINGRVSNWYDELPAYRPALPGDRNADVCIVGAGYTGLWTAYYLKRADPSLRIAVLEARFAGFGASGRNGGWLSGLVPGDRNRMARQYGRDGVVAWQRALNDAVDEVIDVAERENIDAGIVKGGTLQIARNAAQASRLAAEAEDELSWKVGGLPQPALRPHPARTPCARAGRHRRAARGGDLRAVTRNRDPLR